MSVRLSPLAFHAIGTVTDGFLIFNGTGYGSNTWQSSNRALYMPLNVRRAGVVKKLWFENGTTATGNYDIGLYNAAGVALLRKGSTAKTTTAGPIVWDCTDTTIGPGLYYLGLVASVDTDTFNGALTSAQSLNAASGVFEEASALPLPATATFTIPTAINRLPHAGIYLDTRVS